MICLDIVVAAYRMCRTALSVFLYTSVSFYINYHSQHKLDIYKKINISHHEDNKKAHQQYNPSV